MESSDAQPPLIAPLPLAQVRSGYRPMSRPFARSARTPAPIKQLAHRTRQIDFVRCFARAQAQRAGSEVLTGFAQGLDLIHAHLSTPTTDLATLLGHDDAAIPTAALRGAAPRHPAHLR